MSISLLRVALSLVLGGDALVLLLHGGHAGVPAAVAMAIAGLEIAGALLFAIPRTTAIGAWALLASLAAAAVVHACIGELPPPSFVVFALAIVVVMRSAR
jgi:hypothetical protein